MDESREILLQGFKYVDELALIGDNDNPVSDKRIPEPVEFERSEKKWKLYDRSFKLSVRDLEFIF